MKNPKKIYWLSLFYLGFAFISCSQPKTSEEWLQKNSYELLAKEGFNFEAFAASVKDKKIIALGESSHGIGKFYELKSELVKYLHKELGFEVLAMEAGLGDVNLVWSQVDTFTAKGLRDNTVFGNFRAAEVFTLFEYLKDNSQTDRSLIYTGFDSQMSSQYFSKTLEQVLLKYDPKLSDSLDNYLGAYSRWYQAGMRQDSVDYYKQRDLFINTAQSAKKILDENRAEIISGFPLSSFQYQVMIKTLEGFAQSVNLAYEERFQGMGLRDQIMFENLVWLLETIYPNKKIIIWAHNGHIENKNLIGANTKWMGHYLKEKYKENYYALGLFAQKGKVYQHWTEKVIPFENTDSSAVERIIMQSKKEIAFINLENQNKNDFNEWIFKTCTGFELENGGIVSFVPKDRFDGMITIRESDAPTYD